MIRRRDSCLGGVWLRRFCVLLTAFLVSFSTSWSAVALNIPKEKLKFNADNNIIYYGYNDGVDCAPVKVSGDQITLIGDSLSVGAEKNFAEKFPGIDYQYRDYDGEQYKLIQVSKHFSNDVSGNFSGTTIAKKLKEQNELRPYLIFALGTNDQNGLTEDIIRDELIDVVGENQKIVLVTNASDGERDYSVNNNAMKAIAEQYKNVVVADFAAEVAKAPKAYIADPELHVHLSPGAGNQLFVDVIYNAVSQFTAAGGGGGVGNNMNYAGDQVFSDVDWERIQTLQPVYEEVANEYNIDWRMLAVVHKKEGSLSLSNIPSTVANEKGYGGDAEWEANKAAGLPENDRISEGPFGLHSARAGNPYGIFTKGKSLTANNYADFKAQARIAAQKLVSVGGDMATEGDIKRAFFGYNGMDGRYIERAKNMGFSEEEAKNGEGSPYVMNRYDAQRDPDSGSTSSEWVGGYVADYTYDSTVVPKGFGAYVMYQALGGGNYCGVEGKGDKIVSTAMLLAWEGFKSHDKNDPKPEYVTAMKKVGLYIQGNGYYPYGASCDQFVGTVMRYSEVDPEFPGFNNGSCGNPPLKGSQMDHLLNSGKYKEIDHGGDYAKLEPGDIMITVNAGYHILLYLGEIGGVRMEAAASADHRTGEYFKVMEFSSKDGKFKDGVGREYRAFRYIGG